MEFDDDDELQILENSEDEEWRVSAGDFSLVGAEISNYGPVERVFIPLQDNVIVLYGLNGAGKSNVMSALSSALSSKLIDESVTPPSDRLGASPAVKVWLQGKGLSLAIDDRESAWDPLRAIWSSYKKDVETSYRDMGYKFPLETLHVDVYNSFINELLNVSEEDELDEDPDRQNYQVESYQDIPSLYSMIVSALLFLDEQTLVATDDGKFSGNFSDLLIPILESWLKQRITYEVSQHKSTAGLCLATDSEVLREFVDNIKQQLITVIWQDMPPEEVKDVISRFVNVEDLESSEPNHANMGSIPEPEISQKVLSLRQQALNQIKASGYEVITERLDTLPYHLALTFMRQLLEEVLGVQMTPVWAYDTLLNSDSSPGRIPFAVVEESAPETPLRALLNLQEELEEEKNKDTTFFYPRKLLSQAAAFSRGPRSRSMPEHQELNKSLFGHSDGTTFVIDSKLTQVALRLEENANAIYKKLLLRAPTLVCEVNSPMLWQSLGLLTWRAIDLSGSHISLNQLSSAEERWAKFSINLADVLLAKEPDDQLIVMIDEPERALHRRAERHIAQALKNLAENLNAKFILASHSPAFLARRDFSLLHVYRDGGNLTNVHELSGDFHSRAEALGLEPTELLQMSRGILLVEGEHELVVLGELIGTELQLMGIETLCMRGARALKAWDAQLIQRFTDVPFIILTDNDEHERISDIWERSKKLREAGQNYRTLLNELKTGARGSEGDFLRELCGMLIEEAQYKRFSLFALEKADITEYLPVADLSATATGKSWSDLRKEAAKKAEQSSTFKKWAKENYSIDYSNETLRRAAKSMDHIPDDFTKLLQRVEEIAGFSQ